ncbi:RNA-binding protein MEX3A-like isoform X2 [Varroa jacobsoni]|nr:RNA-binding protein MEX3A-like isoform X2 [Varroa jacobsoni]XP_022696515.1 RNA-binding protein MEX3A-like isoform X2 [Varroa jacobsoni]
MPAALFSSDMERSGSAGLEDQRALQLALELSMLGLQPTGTVHGTDQTGASDLGFTTGATPDQLEAATRQPLANGAGPKKSQNTTECVPVPSSEHVAEIVGRQGIGGTCVVVSMVLELMMHTDAAIFTGARARGCAEEGVLSGENNELGAKAAAFCRLQPHNPGCKIKALRAKTNTYIKTPVRGEEPVFVVTGRKEDVAAAKREILSAAEHFSSIRAQRKSNGLNAMAPGPNSNMPGQTTIEVRVPYRVVGLVVGPKGATIKRIQQQTNTYIVTPSREKEPVFEVTGLPENVETARKEIEAHIAMRTGGSLTTTDHGSIGSSGGATDDELNAGGPFGGTLGSLRGHHGNMGSTGQGLGHSLDALVSVQDPVFAPFGSALMPQRSDSNVCGGGSGGGNSVGNNSATVCGFPFPSKLYPMSMSMSLFDSVAHEEESPFDSLGSPVWPSELAGGNGGTGGPQQHHHQQQQHAQQQQAHNHGHHHHHHHHHHQQQHHQPQQQQQQHHRLASSIGGHSTSHSSGGSQSSNEGSLDFFRYGPVGSGSGGSTDRVSPTDSLGSAGRGTGNKGPLAGSAVAQVGGVGGLSAGANNMGRECVVCFESEVVAALVPCGHNLFCLECANRVVASAKPDCPVCHQHCSQAVRIYN